MTPIEQLLPALYRQTPEDTELQRVLTLMLERAERDKDFTLEQLFPSTTSGWGLELWERAWGIPVDRTMSDGRRRDKILAKVKGTGTTTLEVIRAIAESFSPYPVKVVEEAALYRFVIWYLGTIGEVEHREDLAAIVNELKPAHLAWEVKYQQVGESTVFAGCFPRQGDQSIIWEVDCR
ncbi:putative phage tail protein [uncultured Intestinimonas sp.]|uniref:putative phage tail protein n=1 Tax=uncultured Intestinimonas sp. TaxID=1689265 RepID=UPI0026001E65|nr:putative phage tail protein [uncultured Intestinimonas sp.]